MKQLRYGIISTATIVPRFVGAIKQTSHSTVSAIASRSYGKANSMAKTLSIPKVYGSYEELYQDQDIDIVYIATINREHYPQIKAALLHGKHVVCEKPFVLTSTQANELFTLARKQNLFLMEAQKAVFLPVNQKIKEMIKSKELGELRQIDMTQSYKPDYPDNHWMLEKDQGGVLYGSAAYPIELLLYYLDQPKLAWQIHGIKSSQGTALSIAMTFSCNQSILVNAKIAMNVLMKNIAVFYFDHGFVEIDDYWKARTMTITRWDTKKTQTLSFPCRYEMVYEVDHIAYCIQHQLTESPIMTSAMTQRCVKLVEEMAQALENT